MAKRRQTSFMDDISKLLQHMPIWVGPLLALVAFLTIRYGVPLLLPHPKGNGDPSMMLWQMIPIFSWMIGILIIVAWIAAEIYKLSNRRLFNRQSDLNSVRQLSWHEFERLVTETYRRQGYLSEHVGSPAGDGGIDILLHGHGEKVFIQCKQWKAFKVGPTPVRELLGVVTSEKADRGILVTSGQFTSEALRFAERNERLELIDGTKLAALIAAIQRSMQPVPSTQIPPAPRPSTAISSPQCPSCGTDMKLRTARRGAGAGSQFWGCPKYPACKGTRPATRPFPQ